MKQLFLQVKREAEVAYASVMESEGPLFKVLKCYGDKSILLSQDIGTGDTAASDEKWSAFEAEQKEIIEKH
ncbi:hypothetical protein HAX54_034808 [Datura stramonium]|uniref:Uncharacterized protein n=1 Tax=Datura stramonium TaxID=4076 RepID=A0ABS8VHE1_DATST|nr:hypothetical protein [Datura stramonium]